MLIGKTMSFSWNDDDSIEKCAGYDYLWITSPDDSPFSIMASSGFLGVIPDTDEKTFFFSNDFSITSLSYDYSGGAGWLTFGGETVTIQGETGIW